MKRLANRTKVTICLVCLLIGTILLALRFSSPGPAVSLIFEGYSDDGHEATFSLVNHTRGWIWHSNARIQLLAPNGWTNYYDVTEMMMCRYTGPLTANQTTTLSAALPMAQNRWRACVSYRIAPDYDSGWYWKFQQLLTFANPGASTGEVTIVTREFVR